MVFNELWNQLQQFSAQDYATGRPFVFLRDYVQNHLIRYIQFLPVVKADGIGKGADEASLEWLAGDEQRKMRWGQNFLWWITHDVQTTAEQDRIHVMPLMCGSGKSSAISQIIDERIAAHLSRQTDRWREIVAIPEHAHMATDYGLLVVTDVVDRAREYLKPGKQAQYANNLLSHPDLVTLIESEHLGAGMARHKETPVLIITTQRYMRLQPDELEDFLIWDGGRRNLIIIDEQPQFVRFEAVTATSLMHAGGALADKIDYQADQEDKLWCRKQWDSVVSRITDLMIDYESRDWQTDRDQPHVYCWHEPTEEQRFFTEDDERFKAFVWRYRHKLGMDYDTICAAEKILMEGAVYNAVHMTGRYDSQMGVIFNDVRKLTEAPAPVVILDGTGDVSPEYQTDGFVIDAEIGEGFRRNLSNLHITFVDMNTSKARLELPSGGGEMESMIEFLAEKCDGAPAAVFTYERFEEAATKMIQGKGLDGQIAVDHFGGIRGVNDYRELSHIAQLGLFNRSPLEYVCRTLAYYPEKLAELRELSLADGKAWLDRFVRESPELQDVQNRILLSDVEQNLFRGTIRNLLCREPYHYYIFCSRDKYEALFQMVAERYPDATVSWTDDMLPFRLNKIRRRRGKDQSHAQKILIYIDSLPSRTEFTKEDICKQTGLNDRQFNKAKENSPAIADLLAKLMITGRYRYRIP